MRVLFCLRSDYKKNKGGDLTQIFSTARALQKVGIQIEFSSDVKKSLVGFDLIHVFNSPQYEQNLAFMDNAKKQGVPIVFSTIYWSKDEVLMASSSKVQALRRVTGHKIARQVFKWQKKLTKENKRGHFAIEKKLLEMADLFLPNSKSEMDQISKFYGVKDKPHVVVRNAVNHALYKRVPLAVREKYILSVGRIEERKNTCALIEACHQLGIKLVLIGNIADNSYGQRAKDLINKYYVVYIDNIDQNKIIPYYYEAQVHAMVSWYETPGLSSMEAACGGCRVVTTDRGSTSEYFGDQATYCDPSSLKSIKQALRRACLKKFSLSLRNRILKEYTWEGAAQDTIEGYNLLYNKNNKI